MNKALNELSATEAAAAIAGGRFTSEQLVASCLERIGQREPEVAAWAYLDPAGALAAARECDQLPGGNGILAGVPIAFKDVVDTYDMPTAYGSPIYRGWRPSADAVCVANSRRAGAVVLGKTVTTEFASRYPGPTRNPHSGAHTPGGSSSGSAAAVADFMVPLAIGTQTAGSVIRPASYCGIYGYKPTFGLLSFAGVKHLAESVDTLGCMARSLEDIALFRSVLLGVAHSPVAPLGRAPRIGFARTHLWEKAEASTRALIEDAATRLATNGAEVVDFTLPEAFADSETLHRRMTRLEVRNALAHERNTAWENISLSARGSIEEGDEVGFESFVRDLSGANALRMLFDEEMGDLDALITPSAPGEAPAGLSFTGATPFNYLWTLLHTPAVTIPSFTGSGGLPVGLQIVGRRWEDDRVLAVADWVRAQLD